MRGDSVELRADLPGGRRQLRVRLGSIEVTVTEVPGRNLSDDEWQDIVRARRSYSAMWGDAGADMIANDPFDGRDTDLYDARHYLAWLRDGEDPAKLLTMRKVTLVPSALTDRQRADPSELLPLDIRFWKVRRAGGASMPLWDVLRARARRLAPYDRLAEFRIAAKGRTGTFPHGERARTPRERDWTAIAFAAMQILCTWGESSPLYLSTLCPEFRDRVLGIVGLDGVYVPPAFTPTDEVLGLPRGSVSLAHDVPVVREHRTSFPGYFIHNDDAARILGALLDEGRITVTDLWPAIARLVQRESELGRDRRQLDELIALAAAGDHRTLAEVLTRPRLFKYLIPLLAQGGPLARLLREAGDGPFSAALTPRRWATSAWRILEIAEAKYAESPAPRQARVRVAAS
jgi:hypothetical protein